MANIIKLKYSTTTSNPGNGVFQQGELGYSEADGYLYIGDSAQDSIKIGGDALFTTVDGKVDKSLYNANTILKADTDDTPVALELTEGTLLGRLAGGSISALSASDIRSFLNVEDGATAEQAWGDITGDIANQTDLVNYITNISQGLDAKASVKVATTGNVVLSGVQAIDGVTLVAGDRILVKSQDNPAENGIYVVDAGVWPRAEDLDSWEEVPSSFVFVEEGTLNADTGWVCTSDAGGTLGTTDITFVQFSGAGSYSADGQGIELSGNQFSLELDGTTLAKSGSGLKVAAGGITDTEVAADAAIAYSKLATLTASRALVSDANGVLTVSNITATELDYLDGVTSNIQTQLDAKLEDISSQSILGLSDTPSAFVADYFLKVNAAGDAIEFTNVIDGGTF